MRRVGPPRPFWQALLLEAVKAAAQPLAYHAGKAFREALAARRAPAEVEPADESE